MLAERVDETEQSGHPSGLSFLIRYSLTKLVRFLSASVFETIVFHCLVGNASGYRLPRVYMSLIIQTPELNLNFEMTRFSKVQPNSQNITKIFFNPKLIKQEEFTL